MKKILFIFLFVYISNQLCASNTSIDTMYNTSIFLIYFDTTTTTVHIVDKVTGFHHEERNIQLFDRSVLVPFVPYIPALVADFRDTFYFSFSWDYLIFDVIYEQRHFFKYSRKDKKFDYIKVTSHESPEPFHYIKRHGYYKKDKIKIHIFRRGKDTYLGLKFVFYPLKKNGKPQRIKELYRETHNIERPQLSGFLRIYIKAKTPFLVVTQ